MAKAQRRSTDHLRVGWVWPPKTASILPLSPEHFQQIFSKADVTADEGTTTHWLFSVMMPVVQVRNRCVVIDFSPPFGSGYFVSLPFA